MIRVKEIYLPQTRASTNGTSHRASTSTRWYFAFGAIRICSV